MQIVYVLGKGSKHGNVELRWSLRSIAKHGRGISQVVVAGEDPGFLNPDEVLFVPLEDRFPAKHENILDHLLALIDRGICTKEFLYSSDDHVYVADVDFDRYPYYMRGELKSEAEYGQTPINKYRRSCIDTKRLLEEHAYPSHCFHGHVNTHIDPKYADDVKRMVAVEPRARYGYEPTEMFMNAKSAKEDLECVYRPDIKVRHFATGEELERRLVGYDCFSFGDSVFDGGGFEKYMELRFPGFCKYEKEGTR